MGGFCPARTGKCPVRRGYVVLHSTSYRSGEGGAMSPRNQALWRRISDLLDELLGLPESERDAALARMDCDDTTRAELRRLLAAVRKSDRFLERVHKPHRPQLL